MKFCKLDKVAEVTAGQGAPQGESNYTNNGLPFIKAGNLENLLVTNDEYKTCKLVSKEVSDRYRLKLFPKNALVFAKSGMSATKGRIYCLKNDAYIVNHLAVVIPDNNAVESKYLKYFLNVFPPLRLIKDESYPSISLNDIKKIEIPLPSLEEQKQIIKILDEVDALRQKRKQAIGLLDNYLKSVFLKMFGDPVKNEKGWREKKTSEIIIGNAQNGFFAKNEHYKSTGTPIVWISDFINLPYAKVENIKRVIVRNKDVKKYKVAYGDVLFCRSSLTVEGIGKCSIIPENVPEETIYECHIIKISLDKKIVLPEYFRGFSETSFFQNQIIQKSKTSTMTTIAQDGILKTKILVPPIEIQKDFLKIIKKQETIKQKMLVQSEEMQKQFQALMQKSFKS